MLRNKGNSASHSQTRIMFTNPGDIASRTGYEMFQWAPLPCRTGGQYMIIYRPSPALKVLGDERRGGLWSGDLRLQVAEPAPHSPPSSLGQRGGDSLTLFCYTVTVY